MKDEQHKRRNFHACLEQLSFEEMTTGSGCRCSSRI
ncbi:MAG: hypothetical protein JSC085_000414 [Candidatus Tokpelaia sp. JSC085]|nr:MAG: hypothetical protein JSC085_000414 [Candidatus Tokpelaia sp. JSC085]